MGFRNSWKTVHKGLVVVFLLALVGSLMACGGGGASTEPGTGGAADGKALLESQCASCHGLDQVTEAQKSQAQWEQTVARMVEKGASLSADEQEVLVTYLAETYGP